MKKRVLALVLGLSLFASGAAVASSQYGQYKGMEIVRVLVNGNEIHPEVPAHIKDGSTFLPLRAISEALGAKVEWQGDTYTATVDMPKQGLSLTELNRIGENVGIVYAYDQSGNYKGQGSGFLLSNGVFLTNYHVGAAGTKLRIDINGKTINTNGESLFKNETADIFAVKVEETNALDYTTTLPAPGERVYALGFPRGKFQITEGTYSYTDSEKQIVSSAKTDKGSSGGVLINFSGQVIGVTSAGVGDSGFNAAIPMSIVKLELDKLK